MNTITKPVTREIIQDFANEIQRSKSLGNKPAEEVIKFRSDVADNLGREIYRVPIGLLRFRKDNGRIAADVINYEKNYGKLVETEEQTQTKLRQFLQDNSIEKNDELTKSISQEGQRQPAIITCDGFLINGNRRKMILEGLLTKTNDQKFGSMKVIILPGENDDGGPPTLLEIEQIENRYQNHREGKAEYYNLNRAISMRRKINIGMTLEEQLRDDPNYTGLGEKEFKSAVKLHKEKYLKPLECIDRYLKKLEREDLYENISTKLGDPEGRWQAFLDYYGLYKKINDDKERLKLGLEEDEAGKIEDVAFKIIRQREFPFTKLHKVMRDLPKLVQNKEPKKELYKLLDVSHKLKQQDDVNSDDGRNLDKRWRNENGPLIVGQVKKALYLHEADKQKETPLTLLRDALKKLNHKEMNSEAIKVSNAEEAMQLADQIEDKAHELRNQFDKHRQELNKLGKRFSSSLNKN